MLNYTSYSKMVDSKNRPYFLWDMDISIEEFRQMLNSQDEDVRTYMLGKLMRQAKPDDVFLFVTINEIKEQWDQVQKYLGRTREFWQWLILKWGLER